MKLIPVYSTVLFGLSALFVCLALYKASRKSGSFLIIMTGWIIVQSVISLDGFYTAAPLRFPLMILPAIAGIVMLFLFSKGREIIDRLDMRWLTLVHIVRIPVEIGLYGLFLNQLVPQLMTFEGRNFDILAGLSAPVIYYFVFIRRSVPAKALLIWNFISLALLLNIVINAVLSVPTPFQQFGIEQPAAGLLYFPVTLLPSVIVPIVLLSQLAVIRQLTRNREPAIG